MNVVLFDKPLTKTDLMNETLCSCSHVLELDVMREDLINYSEIDKEIYPFQYSIKETNSTSKTDKKKLGSIDHLLFFQYPEFQPTLSNLESRSLIKSVSSEFRKPLNTFIENIIDIPQTIIDNSSFDDLQYQLNVGINLSIIETNLSMIQKSYLKNSKKWAINVYIYKDIIEELLTFSFNTDELQHMQNILNNIKTLLAIVQSDIASMEYSLQKKSMYQIQKENHDYAKLLENINYIEIKLKPLDNSMWIYEMCSGYTITQIGDDFRISSEFPDKLLSLYSKILSLNKNNLVFLKMEKSNEMYQKNAITHTIEGNSNVWAYVYYKMFGENIKYTQKNDYAVQNIVNTAKKLNLPIEYLI